MFTTKDGKNRFTMKKEEELIYDSERKEDTSVFAAFFRPQRAIY
jgi:hypothetical protein